MPSWNSAKFELHDSELEAVAWTGADVTLTFSMVTHTSDGEAAIDAGETWLAKGVVSIIDAKVVEGRLEPDELGGGCLAIDDTAYNNCIPIALSRAGAITLTLETFHGPVAVAGRSITVAMVGEPERCGTFPGTTRPN